MRPHLGDYPPCTRCTGKRRLPAAPRSKVCLTCPHCHGLGWEPQADMDPRRREKRSGVAGGTQTPASKSTTSIAQLRMETTT